MANKGSWRSSFRLSDITCIGTLEGGIEIAGKGKWVKRAQGREQGREGVGSGGTGGTSGTLSRGI